MRRTRDALLSGLELPVPVDPPTVFAALCASMARRHRAPVEYRLVRFPVCTVSGLLVRTDARALILIEENTSAEHQLCILGHEFWHMEQEAARPRTTEAATQTEAEEEEEADCEVFGSLIASRCVRWLQADAEAVPESASQFGRRLHATLGHTGTGMTW
ncbi:hypothetical protein DEJ50_30745 [Streptomyces venezuelae]|uniref:IrrE N-terminal-like domain-containing protein n=2 Tax=Streptomyces venezuelae TaxID=54571 RepID=A0A5P2D928_STRVZ|nr:hypothetical protein DEJ50_30745 [Streptomyces venezuelae]